MTLPGMEAGYVFVGGSALMHRTVRAMGPVLLLGSGLCLFAADGSPQDTPAETLAALEREYARFDAELDKALEAAKTDSERNQVWDQARKQRRGLAGRARAVARANPKDPPALEALAWVITGGQG